MKVDPATGKPSLFPIEDEKNVDKRRMDMGLMPLKDYLKNFGVEYEPKG